MNSHVHHHTGWYWARRIADTIALLLVAIAGLAFVYMQYLNHVDNNKLNLFAPVGITVTSHYKLFPGHGIRYKELKNVGVTYYAVGEPTVPGVIGMSGRMVYDGCIAVSRDLYKKEVWPGDLIYVKMTDRFYKVEDTMADGYTNRVDIFTFDMKRANSGSHRSDVIIVNQAR